MQATSILTATAQAPFARKSSPGRTLPVLAVRKSEKLWNAPLRPGQALSIHCESGAFWITREGSRVDHVLQAGETLELSGPGLVVITELKPGAFSCE